LHDSYKPIDGSPIDCTTFKALEVSIAHGEMLLGQVTAYEVLDPAGIGGYPYPVSFDEARANAKLIVRAVNNFEAMRDALIATLGDDSLNDLIAAVGEEPPFMAKVRAALALADKDEQ
jgi:hypothetical protein